MLNQQTPVDAFPARRAGDRDGAGRGGPKDAGAGWPRWRLAAAAHKWARRIGYGESPALRAFILQLSANDRLSFSAQYYAGLASRAERELE